MIHAPNRQTRPLKVWGLLLSMLLVMGVGFSAQAQDAAELTPPAVAETTGAVAEEAEQVAQDAAEAADASAADGSTDATASADEEPPSLGDRLDSILNPINGAIFTTLFFDVSFGLFGEDVKLPFLVVWLGFGAMFYTVYHGFINIRGFRHAWQIVRGKWAGSADDGDIPPFRALTSALSATVGLGNIAGVAIAMVVGGPGALFWMMVLGLFGMTSKFHETTLAQMFRVKNDDGSMSGGPMYFLDRGLKQINPNLEPLGKTLAVVFAIFLMGAALGGGNMFQANQSFEACFDQFVQPFLADENVETARRAGSVGFGIVMAAMVSVVIIGGIGRIGAATSIIVPVMATVYVAACSFIIVTNAEQLPSLIGLIFQEAWAPEAGLGGVLGAMMVGFQRAAFSSEAGIGSSAVAHSAAKVDEPIREGFVASLEPFIDTIVICFMTGMVVLITGTYQDFEPNAAGAAVTLAAFESRPIMETLQFPKILTISIVLFAFSTMISWCYYGERAWGYLFGIKSVIVFRLVFVVCVFVGSVASLGSVIDSADAMLLACGLPNILGGIILAPLVKKRLKAYWLRYCSGEMKPGEVVAKIPSDDGPGANI
ncbi:alanine/glycine:cation symporter family protein [Algisphaera agarilytica]|uniref:AGCS family alanine or glycine:cation symporter n=1 Tax=Algisphaera agarilytica TaxID=1385975 RepID=A0A7X0H8T7_9BACT|nr:alanine/glycine:cation symporter family protein [Algisphaera agarilytica]MBB6431397.1 AGCS family alanine or glycine:cation symporter [Algisphaera agarilytica]